MKLSPLTPSRKLAAACAVAALGSIAAPSYALTVYVLDVPAGPTYGTVSLTQVDGDTVHVNAVLTAGYNFVDTGTHEAFGFNVAGSPTVTSITPPPCQGRNPTSVPNHPLDFDVNLAGITESSFIANAAGFTFTADLFGPSPSNPNANLTFAVGSGSTPVPFIPEPETYALMLAGLGVVGFVARRRRA